jgi:GTP-dependent dephospho-CoA kinase
LPFKFSSKVYPVPDEIRSLLKAPLGELILDRDVTKIALSSRLAAAGKDSIVVSIGDRSTERLLEYSISHNLEIVDRIEKRKIRPELPLASDQKLLRAKNDPGTISGEALAALSQSLGLIEKDLDAPVRIEIGGEEDLLTLPVLAFFPPETIVMYGQPNEGLVIVHARGEPRIRSWDILAELGIRSL